jgi:hypothetical protein
MISASSLTDISSNRINALRLACPDLVVNADGFLSAVVAAVPVDPYILTRQRTAPGGKITNDDTKGKLKYNS